MWHTIESSLVHKHSPEQVLVSSAHSEPDGSLVLDVALAPTHPATGTNPIVPTLLGIELMRQATIAFAHLTGEVPRDWAFLMNEINFLWRSEPLPMTPEKFAGRVQVRLQAKRMRNGHVGDLQVEADFLSGRAIVGTGFGDLSCLPPRAYQAIRRNAPPATDQSTGPLGTVLANVSYESRALEALLVWSREDKFIFDHPSDHLSGMLLASAVLEAHQMMAGTQALNISFLCHNFAEYDSPIRVSGSLNDAGQSTIAISQSGRAVATGRCAGSMYGDGSVPAAACFHRQLSPSR
ncbi:AfsA-related hotdog domain-containing protein [Arthrobacter sp. TMN-49]